MLDLLLAALLGITEVTFDPNGKAVSEMKAYLREKADAELAATATKFCNKLGVPMKGTIWLLTDLAKDYSFGGKLFTSDLANISLLNYNAYTIGGNAAQNHKLDYVAEVEISCPCTYVGHVSGKGEVHDQWDFHPDNTGPGWKAWTYNLLAKKFNIYTGFYWFWGAADVKTHMYWSDSWDVKYP